MRIFYILSFIVLSIGAVQAQERISDHQVPEAKIVKFYPNPATSIITFDFQNNTPEKTYSFQIYNFLGKKVYESPNITPRTTVNLNDFIRGVYIFQIRDKNGKVIDSGRFQVTK